MYSIAIGHAVLREVALQFPLRPIVQESRKFISELTVTIPKYVWQ